MCERSDFMPFTWSQESASVNNPWPPSTSSASVPSFTGPPAEPRDSLPFQRHSQVWGQRYREEKTGLGNESFIILFYRSLEQVIPEGRSWWTSHPSRLRSVAWNWWWWECLHCGDQEMLPRQESSLETSLVKVASIQPLWLRGKGNSYPKKRRHGCEQRQCGLEFMSFPLRS